MNIIPLTPISLLSYLILIQHDQPRLIFDLEFSFLPEDSRLTCAPDPPNDVDGHKNPTPDPVLAADRCTLTTAEPPRLQSAVVITQ